MRILLMTAAALALSASAASAQLLKNFKYDGSVDVNAYTLNNRDFKTYLDDNKSFADTRLLLNVSFDLGENARAVVSAAKSDRQYGQAAQAVNGAKSVLAGTYFEQAYADLHNALGLGLEHKIGRQYYGEPGDIVLYFGPEQWPYPSPLADSALDGWTAWYRRGGWTVNTLMSDGIITPHRVYFTLHPPMVRAPDLPLGAGVPHSVRTTLDGLAAAGTVRGVWPLKAITIPTRAMP